MNAEELERQLIAARAGSLDAFGNLVVHFEPRLFLYLRHRVGCDKDAEDLTQEALLRAWRNLHRYDPRWKFSTWLYTLTSRLAISHNRRPTPLATVDTGSLEARAASPSNRRGAEFLEKLEREEESERVWALARKVLSEESMAALWLRYAEDLEPTEIARVLGKEPGSVRVMLHRARERVRASFDQKQSACSTRTSEVTRHG